MRKRITSQTVIEEEMKRRLNSGNACCHSVQKLLSSRLLSTNVEIRIYRTIIFLVVLYGWETWSLILREEHRLRVFENRVEGRNERRLEKTAYDELHNLYSSPSVIRMREDEMGRVYSTNGVKRNAYRISVGKAEGNRTLGRQRRR
jgi:hypothetical protein